MARLTIYRDSCADATMVSNCFIDHYMKDANDAQLKVYFYLLRMLGANQPVSVSNIADQFNHTEKEVMRALKYWEGKQLWDLLYDEEQNLTGIHLREFPAQPAAARPSEIRLQKASVPDASASGAKASGTEAFKADSSGADMPGTDSSGAGLSGTDMSGTDSSRTGAPAFRKPSYTTEQLREFRNREETAQLLFIAQSYLGKPLTPGEIKSILFIMDELHFSEDLVDYLIQYCVDRGKKDFKYIEKVAISWAEQGVTTPEEAQKCAVRYDRNVYAIMNQLGKSGSPTDKELEYITRWKSEYGFSDDIIFEACDRTVLATDRHRFEYCDSILSSWRASDVHRKSDILRIDELYQQKRRTTAKGGGSNKFNHFKQNDYNFEELEQELISN